MINSGILLTMAETQMENPSFFPFPFPLHLIFAIIATVFLIFRFVTDKKPFQLIMAVAIPFSLILWTSQSSMKLYYIVGLIELILIVLAFVSTFIFKDKNKPVSEKNADDSADENNEVQE